MGPACCGSQRHRDAETPSVYGGPEPSPICSDSSLGSCVLLLFQERTKDFKGLWAEGQAGCSWALGCGLGHLVWQHSGSWKRGWGRLSPSLGVCDPWPQAPRHWKGSQQLLSSCALAPGAEILTPQEGFLPPGFHSWSLLHPLHPDCQPVRRASVTLGLWTALVPETTRGSWLRVRARARELP